MAIWWLSLIPPLSGLAGLVFLLSRMPSHRSSALPEPPSVRPDQPAGLLATPPAGDQRATPTA